VTGWALKGKGTMVLSRWSNPRDGFGSKGSILGILLPILRRSYRVIRRFKCKVSFSICDVVANLHDRPQACSAQKSNGFMVRQHTCPLCSQGVILLVSLVCLLWWTEREIAGCLQNATRCPLMTSSEKRTKMCQWILPDSSTLMTTI
jgi:hypothetical protein